MELQENNKKLFLQNDNCFLDKEVLMKFIVTYHLVEEGLPISPIKLNKSLYFLYAEWMGVKSTKETFAKDLFLPRFEAWKYGVVDPTYKKIDRTKEHKVMINPNNEIEFEILVFLMEGLLDIFSMDDFTLVGISQEDSAWRDFYREGEKNRIPKKNIVLEYIGIMNGDF